MAFWGISFLLCLTSAPFVLHGGAEKCTFCRLRFPPQAYGIKSNTTCFRFDFIDIFEDNDEKLRKVLLFVLVSSFLLQSNVDPSSPNKLRRVIFSVNRFLYGGIPWTLLS